MLSPKPELSSFNSSTDGSIMVANVNTHKQNDRLMSIKWEVQMIMNINQQPYSEDTSLQCHEKEDVMIGMPNKKEH